MEEVVKDSLYGFQFRDVDLRRTPEGVPRKQYQIKALWQRSHEIINLAARGFKQCDIAEILNISEACVSMTLNSELGRKKLAEIRYVRDEDAKKTSEKIRILTAKALEKYHEIFDNEDGSATLKDQKDVADTVLLELSGLRAPTKFQSSSINMTLSKEDIESFKSRGREAVKEAGLLVDVTPKE